MSELKTKIGKAKWMTLFRTPLYSERAMKVLEAARERAEKYYRLARDLNATQSGAPAILKLYARREKRARSISLFYYCDEPKRDLDGRIGLQLRVEGAYATSVEEVSAEQAMFIEDEFKRYGLPMSVWKELPEIEIYDGVKAKDAACVCAILKGTPLASVERTFGRSFVKDIIGTPSNAFIVEQRRHLLAVLEDAYKEWHSLYYKRTYDEWKLSNDELAKLEREIEAKRNAIHEAAAEIDAVGEN